MCQREVLLTVLSAQMERLDVVNVNRIVVQLEINRLRTDETPPLLRPMEPLDQRVPLVRRQLVQVQRGHRPHPSRSRLPASISQLMADGVTVGLWASSPPLAPTAGGSAHTSLACALIPRRPQGLRRVLLGDFAHSQLRCDRGLPPYDADRKPSDDGGRFRHGRSYGASRSC